MTWNEGSECLDLWVLWMWPLGNQNLTLQRVADLNRICCGWFSYSKRRRTQKGEGLFWLLETEGLRKEGEINLVPYISFGLWACLLAFCLLHFFSGLNGFVCHITVGFCLFSFGFIGVFFVSVVFSSCDQSGGCCRSL